MKCCHGTHCLDCYRSVPGGRGSGHMTPSPWTLLSLCVSQVCTGPQMQCVVSSLIVSNLESATDLLYKMLHQSVEVQEIVT